MIISDYTNRMKSLSIATLGSLLLAGMAALLPVSASATSKDQPSLGYLTNFGSNNVLVIDLAAKAILHNIPVGANPSGIELTHDGKRAYVTNSGATTVSVIDIGTNAVIDTINLPPNIGTFPIGVTMRPGSEQAWVTVAHSGNREDPVNGYVVVIDTSNNKIVGDPIQVATFPSSIAFLSNGKTAYVANHGGDNVSVIDAEKMAVMTTIDMGLNSGAPSPAVFSGNKRLYVSMGGHPNATRTVNVINTETNQVSNVIRFGDIISPNQVGILHELHRVYVADLTSNTVSVIDTTDDTLLAIITEGLGSITSGIAIDHQKSLVYAINLGSGNISVITTDDNKVSDTIELGEAGQLPIQMAILNGSANRSSSSPSRSSSLSAKSRLPLLSNK